MNAARPRLLAQFGDSEPIELWRANDSAPRLPEEVRILLVCDLGEGWTHWMETPMLDREAIGRLVQYDPVEMRFGKPRVLASMA